jgi:hypothetical protein
MKSRDEINDQVNALIAQGGSVGNGSGSDRGLKELVGVAISVLLDIRDIALTVTSSKP